MTGYGVNTGFTYAFIDSLAREGWLFLVEGYRTRAEHFIRFF